MAPGDMVEFIGPDNAPPWDSGLVIGARYEVMAVLVSRRDGSPVLRLVGNPGRWLAYSASAFRPLGKRRDLNSLFGLTDAPRELEPA